MKECRLLFRKYEYHVSKQNGPVNIMTFILSHPASFTERQKMFFALIDYNFTERRVFIPAEQELYDQLKSCRTVREIINLLYNYQVANQRWYDYIRDINVSSQELMNRALANFITERNMSRFRESVRHTKKENKDVVNLKDIVKRLDEIERFIGLKKKEKNYTEKGGIILE